MRDIPTSPFYRDYSLFCSSLINTFDVTYAKEEARRKAKNIRQGNDSVSQYGSINYFQTKLNQDVKTSMFAGREALPDTLALVQSAALKAEDQIVEVRHQLGHSSLTTKTLTHAKNVDEDAKKTSTPAGVISERKRQPSLPST